MMIANAKLKGAYYTPTEVASTLVHWAVRSVSDRMLDPSCGDGQFLALHANGAGVEQDVSAVAIAARRTSARIYVGDFFDWASNTRERFECAAGNPPFIRYQQFAGAVRDRALALCQKLGVRFSSLTASWAPFLVCTASLLKPGGRMAFVVPAEIGHATYCQPLINFLAASFESVQVIAVRRSVFPELSQDIWFLFADGYGGQSSQIGFNAWDAFRNSDKPPRPSTKISLGSWKEFDCRLRPFILPDDTRSLYRGVQQDQAAFRLGKVARVGIGYVTGANEFFHLRPSVARSLKIPRRFLLPAVRNSRSLPARILNQANVDQWLKDDQPCLLLRLQAQDRLPAEVIRYLESPAGEKARTAYKCRNRNPWYAVPDVDVPDGFLSYMSNLGPSLVTNEAGCVGTNSVHAVRMLNGHKLCDLQAAWQNSFTVFSTEFEGHALGGGMLKLEPREAARITFAGPRRRFTANERQLLDSGTFTLRKWRLHE